MEEELVMTEETRAIVEKLTIGDRVVLPAVEPCEDFPEGCPEEHGELLNLDLEGECATVQLDEDYLEGPEDDGLREVSLNTEHVPLLLQ